MGKLIAIDGLDGSGKTTQTQLLYENILSLGKKIRTVSFPNYESVSSSLVKMYLGGEFGNNPNDVGAYPASTFYAVDRFASFRTDWKKDYDNGDIILCNRYTTANLFHQMEKLPMEQWDEFICWLEDFEYNKLGLPRPDVVLYLDMHPDISKKLIDGRYNGDDTKRDIHEKDYDYLNRCRVAALYAAKKLGWTVINCYEGDNALSREEIQTLIFSKIRKEL